MQIRWENAKICDVRMSFCNFSKIVFYNEDIYSYRGKKRNILVQGFFQKRRLYKNFNRAGGIIIEFCLCSTHYPFLIDSGCHHRIYSCNLLPIFIDLSFHHCLGHCLYDESVGQFFASKRKNTKGYQCFNCSYINFRCVSRFVNIIDHTIDFGN